MRDELATGTDCYIDPAVLLSHLGWVAQPWVTEGPKALCLPLALTSASCLQLTPTAPAPVYNIVSWPPASAVLPLIYTGASLDWQLGRGSVYNTYVNAFHLYQMNINFSVFMKVFAIWESDTCMKSNVFFIIGFTRLILFPENPWLRKLTDNTRT